MNQDVLMLKKVIRDECDNSMQLIFDVRGKWKSNEPTVPESLGIAQCVFQIICLKAQTILVMSEGTNPMSNAPKVIDFSSILPVVRSIYELCFMFHNIFVTTDSVQESEILLAIWQIRGFNSRQRIEDIPDKFKSQKANEEKEIEELKKKVISTISTLDTTDKVLNEIQGILNYKGDNLKGFRFVKENGKIVEIKDVHVDQGVQEMPQLQNTEALYNWASMHTHGSFMSVLQFGQAYNSNVEQNQLKTILTSVYLILTTVSSDFKDVLKKWDISSI